MNGHRGGWNSEDTAEVIGNWSIAVLRVLGVVALIKYVGWG